MPWSANANCYNFTADSIKQHAPTGAGVFGLYNFRHQLVIASATNLRAELLHHFEHTRFRFPRLTPTGFIFEPCASELRELRAQELAWEYSPLLENRENAGLRAWWRAWRDADARAFQPRPRPEVAWREPEPAPTPAPKPVSKLTKPIAAVSSTPPVTPAKRGVFRLPAIERQGSVGLVGAAFGVIFLAVGLIGLLPHLVTMSASFVGNNASAGARQRLAQAEQPPEPLNVTTNEIAASTSAVEETSKPETSQAAVGFPAIATAPAVAPAAASAAGWSVQALATTEKQIANEQAWKLKAKGYEAFLVEATIKGQTWYRVRIGNFASRPEAESFRVGLRDKEGLRDAFVAANAPNAVTLAALNRR